ECCVEVAIDIDRMTLGRIGHFERCRKRICLVRRSSTDQQADALVIGKAARDIAAEIAIAADDQDARYHVGLVTISQKMTTSPPNAGQPSANHLRNRRS